MGLDIRERRCRGMMGMGEDRRVGCGMNGRDGRDNKNSNKNRNDNSKINRNGQDNIF